MPTDRRSFLKFLGGGAAAAAAAAVASSAPQREMVVQAPRQSSPEEFAKAVNESIRHHASWTNDLLRCTSAPQLTVVGEFPPETIVPRRRLELL